MAIYSPDLLLRQPLTLAAISPLLLSYYVQAVLTILPDTFVFKLLLLPFILWQAWRCAVGLDFGVFLTQLLGHRGTDRVAFWNLMFVAVLFGVGLRAIEWTFIKSPLRRYAPRKQNQDPPIQRRPSASTVFLDSCDLLCNQREIGWVRSHNPGPSPRESTPPPSIPLLLAKALLKLTVLDASQYIIQSLCPPTNNPKGGSIFDPNLALVPRTALAAFCGIMGGLWVYAMIDSQYHIEAVIGRTIFRHPASAWPRIFNRPWMSTSIQEFWNFRWHQLHRNLFIVFGARPSGALLGKPGAFMGGFAVSAVFHHLAMWGTGNGTEFVTAGGFFLLMGIGAVMEVAFARKTGLRVRGWIGWLWTSLWTTLWGMFMIDGWARHGVFATEVLPNGFRPGKVVVDAIVTLSSK